MQALRPSHPLCYHGCPPTRHFHACCVNVPEEQHTYPSERDGGIIMALVEGGRLSQRRAGTRTPCQRVSESYDSPSTKGIPLFSIYEPAHNGGSMASYAA